MYEAIDIHDIRYIRLIVSMYKNAFVSDVHVLITMYDSRKKLQPLLKNLSHL